jgi:hypothetical protein
MQFQRVSNPLFTSQGIVIAVGGRILENADSRVLLTTVVSRDMISVLKIGFSDQ